MLQRYVSKELTHFVGSKLSCKDDQYDLLLHILKEGMLRGSGMAPHLDDDNMIVITINPRGGFSTETQIKAPAVCFCDIPVNDLGLHIKKYGKFGFGLSFLKKYLIPKRVNPVFYVALDSKTIGHRKRVLRGEHFDEMLQLYDRLVNQILPESENEYQSESEKTCQYDAAFIKEFRSFDNFFKNEILAFLKPFNNYLAESDSDNFYMEREWRVLGRVKFEIDDVHRIIVPDKYYAAKLRKDMPSYEGQLNFADDFVSPTDDSSAQHESYRERN